MVNTLNQALIDRAWISVEDMLPDPGINVLVTCKTKKGYYGVNRGFYMDGFWHGSGSMSNVIAWMPMPAPYRED